MKGKPQHESPATDEDLESAKNLCHRGYALKNEVTAEHNSVFFIR